MNDKLIDATVQVVASYLTQNEVAANQLPALIEQVAHSIARISGLEVSSSQGSFSNEGQASRLNVNNGNTGRFEGRSPNEPAIAIEDSVTDDYIICLEDGKKLKMLKRHLKSFYNMSPDDYRRKWGLPKNYPMVCRNYANLRSRLAKEGGLGVGIQPKVAGGEYDEEETLASKRA